MTDLLAQVRAADPAVPLARLLTVAQQREWCEAGLRQVLSGAAQADGVGQRSGESDVAVTPLPAQRRTTSAEAPAPSAAVPERRRAGAPGELRGSRVGRPRGSRRWWVGAAGAAAAAALAVVLGLPGRTPPAVAATPPSLHYAQVASTSKAEAQLLARNCLERQRSHRTAPDSFTVRWSEWSLNTRVDGTVVTSAVVPVQVSLTRRADGSAELVRRTSAPQFPDKASRERWADEGRPAATPVTLAQEVWGPGGLEPRSASLPADPGRLLPALARDHPIAELGDAEVLVAVADAYRAGELSPAQRAAMFSVVASRRGVEALGRVTDRAGRPGYALSVESDHSGLPTRYTAIFDPASGRLLDLEQTLTRTAGALNVPVPSTIAYTVFE
jgi:hypothetical protein